MWRQELSHPWLLLLAVVPVLILWLPRLYAFRRRGVVSISTYGWLSRSATCSAIPRRIPDFFRMLALGCLVFVTAGAGRNQSAETPERKSDAIVIVLDISSSMTAEDFEPRSRLVAARLLLGEFVNSSPDAELGLILVAAFPRLAVPVTNERASLLKCLEEVSPAGFGEDGTAIGSGIASAANRLRSGGWDRRRILLLTDGVNNRGAISPVDAARLAAELGIRIDAVGMGTDRVSRYWVPSSEQSSVEVQARIEIDDKALAEVAGITGGSYRRVVSTDELRKALQELAPDRQRSTATQSATPRFSIVQVLAAGAILLLCAEFAWRRFVFAELPC